MLLPRSQVMRVCVCFYVCVSVCSSIFVSVSVCICACVSMCTCNSPARALVCSYAYVLDNERRCMRVCVCVYG